MAHDAGGHGGGGAGVSTWQIVVGIIALIVLTLYMYTQANKTATPGQKRTPLDAMGITRPPSSSPVPLPFNR